VNVILDVKVSPQQEMKRNCIISDTTVYTAASSSLMLFCILDSHLPSPLISLNLFFEREDSVDRHASAASYS
jgi:hypothetical protein